MLEGGPSERQPGTALACCLPPLLLATFAARLLCCSPPLLPPLPAALLQASPARLPAPAGDTLLLVAWEVRPRFMGQASANPARNHPDQPSAQPTCAQAFANPERPALTNRPANRLTNRCAVPPAHPDILDLAVHRPVHPPSHPSPPTHPEAPPHARRPLASALGSTRPVQPPKPATRGRAGVKRKAVKILGTKFGARGGHEIRATPGLP